MTKLRYQGKGFSITPNEISNDATLSWKAKGLWTYLRSKPEGWDFSKDRIKRDATDGRDSTMTGLQELEDAGYLTRIRHKDDAGHWEWEYILTDTPSSGNPTLENPTADNPTAENPTSNKERSTKKEKEKQTYSADDMRLAELLRDLIKENLPTFKEPNLNQWATHIEKLHRIDGRTYEQIEFIIKWCQQDSFWSGNILSGNKLRKQFDQLTAHAKRGVKGVIKNQGVSV